MKKLCKCFCNCILKRYQKTKIDKGDQQMWKMRFWWLEYCAGEKVFVFRFCVIFTQKAVLIKIRIGIETLQKHFQLAFKLSSIVLFLLFLKSIIKFPFCSLNAFHVIKTKLIPRIFNKNLIGFFYWKNFFHLFSHLIGTNLNGFA